MPSITSRCYLQQRRNGLLPFTNRNVAVWNTLGKNTFCHYICLGLQAATQGSVQLLHFRFWKSCWWKSTTYSAPSRISPSLKFLWLLALPCSLMGRNSHTTHTAHGNRFSCQSIREETCTEILQFKSLSRTIKRNTGWHPNKWHLVGWGRWFFPTLLCTAAASPWILWAVLGTTI